MIDRVYCGSLFSTNFLEHSYKGTEWKDHKYIKKENGRYYYPENYYKNGIRARQKYVTNNGLGVHRRETDENKNDNKTIAEMVNTLLDPGVNGLFPQMDNATMITATNDVVPPSARNFTKDLDKGTIPKESRRVQKLVKTKPDKRLSYEAFYLDNPSALNYAHNLYEFQTYRRKRK